MQYKRNRDDYHRTTNAYFPFLVCCWLLDTALAEQPDLGSHCLELQLLLQTGRPQVLELQPRTPRAPQYLRMTLRREEGQSGFTSIQPTVRLLHRLQPAAISCGEVRDAGPDDRQAARLIHVRLIGIC